ncbi:MAG: hypothetical protein KDB07_07640, partial [Planctomycetes bacterium]|nr:hypothetical protein [Planctomycetota bacterium]
EIVTNASPSANHEGSLATSLLLLPLLAKLTQAGERVAVIDYAGNLYPPALKGVVLEKLVLIRPRRRSDALWAFQQCARSPALALTWAGLPRLDQHQARTLSLAAEAGGGVCVALRRRGEGAAGAALRLKVNPAPARSWHEASAKLELLRSKPAVRREALELRLFEGRTSGQSPNTQTQRGWA